MTATSPELEVFSGIAEILRAADIGAYSPVTVYQSGDVAIVLGELPQEPSEGIALTTYVVQDDASLNDSIIAVQVKLRGTSDQRSIKNRSAAIFNELQGLENQQFGSTPVALIWRQSSRLDGKDDQNRWLSAETYYCRVNWPTTSRTE